MGAALLKGAPLGIGWAAVANSGNEESGPVLFLIRPDDFVHALFLPGCRADR